MTLLATTLMYVALAWAWRLQRGGAYVAQLTDRQCRIVALIEDDYDTEMIAEELGVSRYTIRDHLRTISFKLTGDERGAGMLELPTLARERGACEGVTR